MTYEIQIRRQNSAQDAVYWQTFCCESDGNASVADALRALNARTPLLDAAGTPAQPIGWECSCLVRKCGACAMRINGVPRLACSVFLRDIKSGRLLLEPLSKFPLVRDLIVDRRVIFDRLKEMQQYRASYYEGCGKSLACQDICPAGIPVEELLVRSNAAAIWKR